MKHIIALILAALATLTLAACSNGEIKGTDNKSDISTSNTFSDNSISNTSADNSTSNTFSDNPTSNTSADNSTSNTFSDNSTSNTFADNSTSNTSADNSTSTAESTDKEPAESAYADALAVLEAAWAAYPEDDKFPVFGGSTDVAVEYDGKPGPFTIAMTDEMRNNLKVPENIMSQIKAVASMIHMMNANTFTSAVFEIDGDINAFSTALVDGVNSTHWMCGIPETVITVKVDNYLIMAFGNGGIIEKFKTAATTAVDGAVLVHEGSINFGGGNGGGIIIPGF